jgi:UPF0755 protein
MKKNNNGCLRTLVIWILLLGCLGATSLILLFAWLPGATEKEFGKASADLDPITRTITSVRMLLQKDDLVLPVDPGGKAREFIIQDGESVNLIGLNLENSGLIRDAGAFRLYLIYSGGDTGLQSGTFTLSSGTNTVQIARTLQDPNAKLVTVRILAGWRLEEVAASLAT